MDSEHGAAASAEAGIAQTRRALLAGGALLASGLPMMPFDALAQGALRAPHLPPQPNGATMPKIINHVADDIFDPKTRAALATELTAFALDCETLPKSPFMKSAVWTYFNTNPADTVFMGCRRAGGDDPRTREVKALKMEQAVSRAATTTSPI